MDFLISGDPADEQAYRSLIDAFSIAHPTIQVNLINIPSQSDFRKRLTADFAAGNPPDIFLINYRRYGPFVSKNVIEPLTPYLNQSVDINPNDYYPQALAAFTWLSQQGLKQQMCMPQNMSSPVIYYNLDLFDQFNLDYPTVDWQLADFVETARTLTQDTDGDGRVDIYGFGTEATITRVAPFIWMNGGTIVDDPVIPNRLTLDSPQSKEALDWYVGLQTKEQVIPDAVAEEAESSLSRFVNGRLGMIMESRRATPEFRAIQGFEWDVAPLPVGRNRFTVLHSDAYCITSASNQKRAAWTFVEFANASDGQSILAQTGRTVPSLKAVAESPLFLNPSARPPSSQIFIEAIPHMRTLPLLETWSDIESILNKELENMLMGRVTVDEGIEAANRRSQEFFR
ncbi:MAG: sugar ABC transporter substrate-binding protein [Chloroflexota bacterium]